MTVYWKYGGLRERKMMYTETNCPLFFCHLVFLLLHFRHVRCCQNHRNHWHTYLKLIVEWQQTNCYRFGFQANWHTCCFISKFTGHFCKRTNEIFMRIASQSVVLYTNQLLIFSRIKILHTKRSNMSMKRPRLHTNDFGVEKQWTGWWMLVFRVSIVFLLRKQDFSPYLILFHINL